MVVHLNDVHFSKETVHLYTSNVIGRRRGLAILKGLLDMFAFLLISNPFGELDCKKVGSHFFKFDLFFAVRNRKKSLVKKGAKQLEKRNDSG